MIKAILANYLFFTKCDMGFFDFFTGTKRPAPGTPILPKEEVKKRLLALNDEKKPFQVLDGGAECDVLVEWKIVDAKWYEIFAKAGLKRVFKIYIKLDDEKKMARPLDKEYMVKWTAGVPTLSLAASSFSGQKAEVSFGGSFGVKEDGSIGTQYSYSLNTEEMKAPLRQVVLDCGWVYKPRM